jgi:outer membrane immunogenic protein
MNRPAALTGLAALTLFDIVAAAHAGPRSSAARPSDSYDWSGFYIGGNVGGTWADVDGGFPYGGLPISAFTPTFPVQNNSAALKPNSGVIGTQAGYNYQFDRNWLAGLEADFEYGHRSASTGLNLFDPGTGSAGAAQFSTTIEWSASLRARLGYTWGPWLVYGTAGVSLLRMSVAGSGGYNSPAFAPCFDGFTLCSYSANWSYFDQKLLPGFVIGPGVEYMMPGQRWTLRAQYLFADYGHVGFGPVAISSSFTNISGPSGTSVQPAGLEAKVTTQSLIFGANYRIP